VSPTTADIHTGAILSDGGVGGGAGGGVVGRDGRTTVKMKLNVASDFASACPIDTVFRIYVTRHEIFGPNDVIWTQDHKTEIGDQTQLSSI
jgi:hypothetical protein